MSSIVKLEAFASCEKKPDFVSRKIMQKLFGREKARTLCDVWSHVGIVATFSDGSEKVYDMTDVGVDKTDLKEMLKDHTLPRRIDLTSKLQVPMDYARGWLDGRIGGEYSWSQYILYFLPNWMKHTAAYLSNGREKGVCSEFLSDFCIDMGIISSAALPNTDKVCPKQIIEALEIVTLPRGRV